MYAEEATVETPQLNLPAELLAEVSRRAASHQKDFSVDGWKPSFLERLTRLFGLGGRPAPPPARSNGRAR